MSLKVLYSGEELRLQEEEEDEDANHRLNCYILYVINRGTDCGSISW